MLIWLKRFTKRTPLDGAIALLLVMLVVSLWATFDIRFSLPKVVGLLLGIAVYYLTVAYVTNEARLQHVLVLYVCIATGVAVLGLFGTAWLYKNPTLTAIVQRLPALIRGLPGATGGFHPNEVAGVLLWFLPVQLVLLGWLWTNGRATRLQGILLGLATLVVTGTFLLTQSRGAFLGLGVWLALWGAAADRRTRIGIGVLLVAAVAYVGFRGLGWVAALLHQGIAPSVLGALNWDFRVEVWTEAVRAISDFPFTGMGLGTFRHTVRLMYPLAIIPSYDIAHAHNLFLQAALDLGLPGLVAYIGLWVAAARLTLASLRRARGWLRALALGLSGCLVSFFVYGMLDAVALGTKPGPAWWLMLGLIVALERLVREDGS